MSFIFYVTFFLLLFLENFAMHFPIIHLNSKNIDQKFEPSFANKLSLQSRLWACNARFFSNEQGMSCEGACAHAHVRCAVTHVCVRAKSILESVRDVRACGPF